MKRFLMLFVLATPIWASAQANCALTSVGFTPISDMGAALYDGYDGGLYGGGSNAMPQAHLDAGMALAYAVQPLDANGDPDPLDGRIGWLSIGMSNTQQESQAFINLVEGDAAVNPAVTFVNGAVGGQTAQVISAPWHPGYQNYWSTVDDRLQQEGIAAAQVQVIWLKEANQANNQPLQTYRDSLYIQTKRIMHELNARFPNARLCYMASRIYGGYSTGPLNPEPYAYNQGFIMRQVILDQINGDEDLAFAGSEADSPWMAWGAYLWADGTSPRSDGLTWDCPDDFANDGVHPSNTGREKVAGLLFDFFSNEPTACPWFLATCETRAETVSPSGLRGFPNPAAGHVRIEGLDPRATVIHFLDATGRVLQSMRAAAPQATIDLSGLPNGLYQLSIQDRDARSLGSLRFVKQSH